MRSNPTAEQLNQAFIDLVGVDLIDNPNRRVKEYSEPRQMFCYLLKHLGWRYIDIARVFKQHHASIMRNVEVYSGIRETYEDFLNMEIEILCKWWDIDSKDVERKEIFLNIWNSLRN